MSRGDILCPTPEWRRTLARRLLKWFGDSARDLPWRRTRDLYAIWISEIMLQQTQVATVVPYFERFVARFPDVAALAAADEHDVLKLWEGLGYYRRSRQLHAAARQIAQQHAGEFPTLFEDVRALPGIGRYTAGAILSIGLDQRLPILEANTIRVLSRLIGYRGDVSSGAGQRLLWSTAESILPANRCGAFNQALMELGSEICTPRSPQCGSCPVAALCAARELQLVDRIPRAAKPTKYEEVTEAAVVIRRGTRVLLRQCQAGERWAGLWDFPRFVLGDCGAEAVPRQIEAAVRAMVGVRTTGYRPLATLKHGVTRFRITLHCYGATTRSGTVRREASAKWITVKSLADYPLSVTGRKIAELLAGKRLTRRTSRAVDSRP